MNQCQWHLCKEEAKVKFCSTKCKNKSAVNRFRKNLKTKSVEYKGGKCNSCGYSKDIKALQFHHRDPTQKDFGIGANGVTRKWVDVKIELDKCDMLCANCHIEEHSRLHIIVENV